ncbi:Phox homologous domain-containing protein [Coprinopsis sp. MPI-PUGE-AT-0042]|nr:Phox homologous domain-containing protein [Coprinopsis sp. MPI-PUGE-AT-0042]
MTTTSRKGTLGSSICEQESAPTSSSRPEFEILREESSGSGINIEEEARLYEELCRTYEEEARSFDRRCIQRPVLPPPAGSIFSADIVLGDNRGSGSFASDVEITGWTTVGVPSGIGSGAYVVYDCVVITKENTTFHVLKRYSAFEDLDHALRRRLPTSLLPSLPRLPPKAAFARFRPAFLDRRRQHLQFWLARVVLHPEIGQNDVVKKWIMA